MSRSRWSAIAAAAACLALAAPARADTTSIIAPDMEIDVGDAGDLGAGFVSSGFSTLLPSGQAGLQADVNGTVVGIGGFTADPPDPSPVTGTGAPNDPFKVVTTYHTTGLQIMQTVTHVTGDPRVVVGLDVKNTTTGTLTPRLFYGGDVQGGGFGQGAGALSGDYLAGVFASQGAATGLQKLTPWDHFEEADAADLTTALTDPNVQLSGTVRGDLHDPAVVAEYDRSIPAGQTTHIDVAWKFVPGAANLTLAPDDGSGPPAAPACFTATVTNAYGTPVTGVAVDFAAGDPHPDQATPTDANGQAAYCVTAAEPDEFLFVEADVTDALLSAFSTWTFTGPSSGGGDTTTTPVAGKSVRARLVHGKVRIRHGKTWTALTTPRVLPVGTTLDTRHGTVALTATVAGHARRGAFHGGVFTVRQAGAKDPVAVVLGGPGFGGCGHGSTKVVRRLVASAKGHFQTVGRASTAAGSGSWTTQDRCDGTLTSVQTGAVTVQSAHHHRTVAVHARHRVLMKP